MNEKFFIVPTPIGNLGDITLRALEVLKSVDFIACEDTRVTQKLLNKYEISAKTFAYHKFNEKASVEYILNLLNEGKSIALVSDAGTPLICDPGSILIEELRRNDIKITSLPGASALTTFLSQIPFGDEQFVFAGFMPKKEGQIVSLVETNSFCNMVFYESPNRLLKTLKILKEYNPQLKIAVGRELTKMFEDVKVLNVAEMIEYYEQAQLKGEIVGMIYKHSDNKKECNIKREIAILKEQNFSSKDISIILHSLYGVSKNEVLKIING